MNKNIVSNALKNHTVLCEINSRESINMSDLYNICSDYLSGMEISTFKNTMKELMNDSRYVDTQDIEVVSAALKMGSIYIDK